MKVRTFSAAAVLLGCALAAPAAAQPVVRLPAADQPLAGTPATLHTISGQPGGRAMAGIAQVAFDDRGQLYVLDRGNGRVLLFDARGQFVRQVGSGAVTLPGQMALTRSGELVVSDLGRRAFVVFDTAGRRVRSVPFPANTLAGIAMHPHPRGGVISTVRTLPGSMQGPLPGDARQTVPLTWFRLDAEARAVQLFASVEETTNSPAVETEVGESQRVSVGRVAFSPSLRWAPLADGGLVVGNSARYDVRIVSPNGQVARVLERAIAPRRVNDADRDWARQQQRRAMESGEGVTVVSHGGRAPARPSADDVARSLSGMRFAEVMPVVHEIAVAPSGRIWIGRSGSRAGTPGPVDLVTADGRYVGTLAAQPVPDAFGRDGRVAYVERTGAGERVVVRTLPAAWR